MKKLIIVTIFTLLTGSIFATVSSERRIIGVIKSFNGKFVYVRLKNDSVVKVSRKTIEKKYKKISSGKIIEVSLLPEEFEAINEKSKMQTKRDNDLKKLNGKR